MKLEDYENELNRLKTEVVGTRESLSVNAGLVAAELDRGLWQPGYRDQAARLAGEFREISDRLLNLPGEFYEIHNPTVATLEQHLA